MKLRKILTGALVGLVNGFFGACGGVVAVFMLQKSGLDARKAHAAAVGIILPISFVSLVFYFLSGRVDFSLCLAVIPAGLVGAVVGSLLLKKIKPKFLKLLFAALMIYSGITLITR